MPLDGASGQWSYAAQTKEVTRPPLRRFPFLGGVCNSGAGVFASPSLSEASGTSAWPLATCGAPQAVACEGAGVGSNGMWAGAGAAPAGSAAASS